MLPCLQRSLREAPGLAAAIRDVLARRLPVGETAEAVWDALWPAEKRRQVLACIAALLSSVTNGANKLWHPIFHLSAV